MILAENINTKETSMEDSVETFRENSTNKTTVTLREDRQRLNTASFVRLTHMIQGFVKFLNTQQNIKRNSVKNTMHVTCASKQVNTKPIHAQKS